MHRPSWYWTLLRLNAAGHIKTIVLPSAQAFFQQHFPDVIEPASMEQEAPTDAALQRQLFALRASTNTPMSTTAELCLRCFISHQIVQVCTSIQAQFGHYYGFTLQDLLPYVLNDEGKVPADPQCLAMQILQNFEPSLSGLATWTTRYVKQDHGLNRLLVEHGLYRVSDWAILNDTRPAQLPAILTNFHRFSPTEIEHNVALLESYRRVYLPDRLKQHRRQCAQPTSEQLARMSDCFHTQTARLLPPTTLLLQLQQLAKRLRQYRIYKRGGPLPAKSIDTPTGTAQIEQLEATITDDADEQQQSAFLQRYRELFLESLKRALEQVVSDRQQKSKKPEQARQFTIALHLFYCQQASMTAIAQQLGVRGQDTVTRLLKLKEFRADVRRHMLQSLQSHLLEQVKAYCDPDRLQQLDDRVEAALNEQLEALMQAEAKRDKTSKDCLSESIFAQKLCQHLDGMNLQPPSQPPHNHE
ncbi:MAG: hypothetical protein WCA35_16725 [Kovacikia sp.]